MADLKAAVRGALPVPPAEGLSISQVDKSLGLNQGYPELGGLLAASVLELLEEEGSARKDPADGRWTQS